MKALMWGLRCNTLFPPWPHSIIKWNVITFWIHISLFIMKFCTMFARHFGCRSALMLTLSSMNWHEGNLVLLLFNSKISLTAHPLCKSPLIVTPDWTPGSAPASRSMICTSIEYCSPCRKIIPLYTTFFRNLKKRRHFYICLISCFM